MAREILDYFDLERVTFIDVDSYLGIKYMDDKEYHLAVNIDYPRYTFEQQCEHMRNMLITPMYSFRGINMTLELAMKIAIIKYKQVHAGLIKAVEEIKKNERNISQYKHLSNILRGYRSIRVFDGIDVYVEGLAYPYGFIKASALHGIVYIYDNSLYNETKDAIKYLSKLDSRYEGWDKIETNGVDTRNGESLFERGKMFASIILRSREWFEYKRNLYFI